MTTTIVHGIKVDVIEDNNKSFKLSVPGVLKSIVGIFIAVAFMALPAEAAVKVKNKLPKFIFPKDY